MRKCNKNAESFAAIVEMRVVWNKKLAQLYHKAIWVKLAKPCAAPEFESATFVLEYELNERTSTVAEISI